mgnify:CR=1 FL=1
MNWNAVKQIERFDLTTTRRQFFFSVQACWVILNATSCGSQEQIRKLIDAGCIDILAGLLQMDNMVMMALEVSAAF